MALFALLIRTALYLFLSSSLISCTLLSRPGFEPKEENTSLRNPLKLSLSQGYIAGTTLHLRIQLESINDLPTNSVLIQVKGLKDGVVKEIQSTPLDTVLNSPIFAAGKSALLPFTLSTENLDHFTIACSWGEEGINLISEMKIDMTDDDHKELDIKEDIKTNDQGPSIYISELKVHKVTGTCIDSNCVLRLNLEGKVRKTTGLKVVKNIKLAYRLTWVPDGQIPTTDYRSKELLTDEKLLSFGKDEIPEEGFDFSIKGEKDLPEIPGGKFMPVVRILDYETVR
jgi:hypothetical protein